MTCVRSCAAGAPTNSSRPSWPIFGGVVRIAIRSCAVPTPTGYAQQASRRSRCPTLADERGIRHVTSSPAGGLSQNGRTDVRVVVSWRRANVFDVPLDRPELDRLGICDLGRSDHVSGRLARVE